MGEVRINLNDDRRNEPLPLADEGTPLAAAIPAPEVDEYPESAPVAPARADGRDEEESRIVTGPGMTEEEAAAIREQQRLEYASRQEQQAEREEVFAFRVGAVQEFAGQFEDSVYRTGEAFRGERAVASTELPPAAVQALRQAEAAYQQVVKMSNGRVPENVANALAETKAELVHQAVARQARERLTILQRETRGTTVFGTDKPLQKEMRGVFDSLRSLGNYDQIRAEIDKLQTLRTHKLAKNGAEVNREIARLQELVRAHESVDGLLAWKGLDPNLRRVIAATRAGRRLDFGDTTKHPVDALRQRFYREVVTLLVPPESQPRAEAASSPAPISVPEQDDGHAPQATEAEDESNMDDPVTKLRLSAKRNDETAGWQNYMRQVIRRGDGEPATTAESLIDNARSENDDQKGQAAQEAQQLVADLLDDMKTMTPEELEKTKNWLADFTGVLMASEHAQEFGVDLMDEAIFAATRILSTSGR